MTPFLKNSLIVLGLLCVGYFGYYLYITQSQAVITVDGNDSVSSQLTAETQEFLRRLNQLKVIELSDDLFTDPRFKSLVDYSTPILPSPVGRQNPFEEIN